MAITVTLPDELPLIGGALLSTVVLLMYQTINVGRARARAKIDYPQVYADKAEQAASKDALKFNCAQRAHQNTLESIPTMYLLTGISAVKYPILTASLLGAWTVSRFMYTAGYSTGEPKRRATGGRLGYISLLGLLGTSFAVVGGGIRKYYGL